MLPVKGEAYERKFTDRVDTIYMESIDRMHEDKPWMPRCYAERAPNWRDGSPQLCQLFHTYVAPDHLPDSAAEVEEVADDLRQFNE